MVMRAFYGKKMIGDSFNIQYNDGNARAAIIKTFHGEIKTPVFMPVGTLGSVKAVFPNDLNRLKIDVILANTYHLMIRPGENLIKSFGGLHNFMNWKNQYLLIRVDFKSGHYLN